ncbi:WD40/YVTN/BNR-like repeat-containing protein [Actinopolymorpha pittospori]
MPAGIYVGTDDGLYVLGADKRQELPGRRLRALAGHGNAIWAIVGEAEIFTAGSAPIWRHVTRLRDVRATALYPTPDGVLVGTTDAQVYRLVDGLPRQLESFQSVAGRETWHTPWGDPASVRSISADDDTTYVNVHVGGIVRTTDHGASWEPTIDIEADVHQVLALPGDRPVLAATARGLATSWDHGTSWSDRTLGLTGTYSRALAVCGETVLLSASHGPDGRDAAVYRGEVEGVRLERCRRGLPASLSDNVDTHCLSGDGATAAFGTSDGSVFVSQDAGRTWEQIAEGLPPVRCVFVRE